MLRLLLSITFLFSILFSNISFAAPVFLDNLSDRLDPVIYLGEAKIGDGATDIASIYTTAHSVDIMLNTFEYNHKDWLLYILMETRGQLRQRAIDTAMKYNTQWVNTKSGSRVFWAVGKKMSTNNNILAYNDSDDFFNDEGEFMGSLKVQNRTVDLAKCEPSIGWGAINKLVINYLDKEYQRRYGRDNGQPIQ
jgi:hypothetical protein